MVVFSKKKCISIILVVALLTTLFVGCSNEEIDSNKRPSEISSEEESQAENNSQDYDEPIVNNPSQDAVFRLVEDSWAPLQGGINKVIPIENEYAWDDFDYMIYADGMLYYNYYGTYHLYSIGKDLDFVYAYGDVSDLYIVASEYGEFVLYTANNPTEMEHNIKYGENEGIKTTVAYHTMKKMNIGKYAGSLKGFRNNSYIITEDENDVWYSYSNHTGRLTFREQLVFDYYGLFILTQNRELWCVPGQSVDFYGQGDDKEAVMTYYPSNTWKIENVEQYFGAIEIGYLVGKVLDFEKLYCYPDHEMTPYQIALPNSYVYSDIVNVISDGNIVIIEFADKQFYKFPLNAVIGNDGSTQITLNPVEDLNKYSERIMQVYYDGFDQEIYVLFDDGCLYTYDFQ